MHTSFILQDHHRRIKGTPKRGLPLHFSKYDREGYKKKMHRKRHSEEIDANSDKHDLNQVSNFKEPNSSFITRVLSCFRK
uniref:Uncharacterized protein n=1 Tax=Acrobeloides nanus TaxID=290746 RepID=A0A914C8N8_9BILA